MRYRTILGGLSFRGFIAKGWVALRPCAFGLALLPAFAQPPAPPGQATPPTPQPGATVIFSRDASSPTDSQSPSAQPGASTATAPSVPESAPPKSAEAALAPNDPDPLHITDAERSAPTFTSYDLDLHLTPTSAGLSARAALTLRNDGATPLTRLTLQITSTLHWDAISLRASFTDPTKPTSPTPAHFTSRLVDTDADHTGAMSEAVVTLAEPLAPGASLSLIALYSGAIPASANRLTRIGAPPSQAIGEDWDAIAPTDPTADFLTGTALRGLGNVLWYPVSAPPVFLGDAANLFSLVGHTRLRESSATFRLRLAVETTGEPPDAAYLNGRRAQFTAISDDPDAPTAEATGIATASFDSQPIGFRTPSLFITSAAPHLIDSAHIAAVTTRDAALDAYANTAAELEPLLTAWLGPEPETPLTILDHPGDSFEDDALLVQAMSAQSSSPPTSSSSSQPAPNPSDLAPALAHSLTHAWFRSSQPWLDEGLPEFMSLLWTERTQGRAAALAQLAQLDQPLALAEPDFSAPNHAPSPAGASLAEPTGEVFYRNKAAAVWWMLRSIAGEDALKQALQTYRKDSRRNSELDRDPQGFEHTLEAASHMDLAWFFRDWVYTDRGLPDLRIASVTPSQLEPNGAAAAGFLVAVEVHNDGFAEAEVPVIVRSAGATETRQLRILGRASASVRVVFAGRPDQVQVNDGTVPETQTSIHTRELVLPAK